MRKFNPKLAKLISLLSDNQFHDGDALGESLQMTRSAVWKMIKKLQQYGVAIESVKGKGYVIREQLTLLNPEIISQHVQRECEIRFLESVSSTNAYLKKILSSSTPIICLAEHQTQGVGRFNRKWYSPFGRNIYLSLRYQFHKDISELAGLSLVVSLAILQTIKQLGVQQGIWVKWPNDVLFEQAKLSGTLIEVQAESHGTSTAIIGIGMNVNTLSDDNQITQLWTSLQKILGKYIDRNHLTIILITNILDYLARYDQQGFNAFKDEWSQADCLTGKHVAINNAHHRIAGKVTGVNDLGHLLMRLGTGEIKAFSSGEATIAK